MYLNGRWQFSSDVTYIKGYVKIKRLTDDLEANGRLNQFYALEALALDKDERSKKTKTSTAEFIVFEGKSWTFRETYGIVLRYASWLHERHSIKQGEIVAMDFTNCPDFVFWWFAIWSLGAVPAFINYNLAEKPLAHSVKVSSARLVIVEPGFDEGFTPEVRAELGSTEIVTFNDDILRETRSIRPYRAPDSVREIKEKKTPAMLIYTSGTTGLPKPAVVSWWKCYSGFSFVTNWLNMTTADRFYTAMPLYHSSASILGLLTCLGAACPFILSRKFSVSNFWPEVRSSNATIIQYVGETLRYLLSAPPSPLDPTNKVRVALGNGLRPDIWETFKTRFSVPTIAEFYAATEATNGFWNVSSNSLSSGAIGSKGALATLLGRNTTFIAELDPITEEPIRNPQTGLLIPVPPGSKGEMLFNISDDPERAPRDRFAGYYNNETATTSKLIQSVTAKDDTWYRTGDIMSQSPDGRLTYFSDRIGDTYRWKSENVSTFEVAEVLGRHPAIAEANVYGIQLPHHDGRAGCAAIILKSDHPLYPILENNETHLVDNNPNPHLTTFLASLSTHLSSSLPIYAIPLFVRLIRESESELQRTGNNKQTKHRFRVQSVNLDDDDDDDTNNNENSIPKEQRGRVFWLKGLAQTSQQQQQQQIQQQGDDDDDAAAAANREERSQTKKKAKETSPKNQKGKGKEKAKKKKEIGPYIPFKQDDWIALKEGTVRL